MKFQSEKKEKYDHTLSAVSFDVENRIQESGVGMCVRGKEGSGTNFNHGRDCKKEALKDQNNVKPNEKVTKRIEMHFTYAAPSHNS